MITDGSQADGCANACENLSRMKDLYQGEEGGRPGRLNKDKPKSKSNRFFPFLSRYVMIKILYIITFGIQLLMLQAFLGNDPRMNILSHGLWVISNIVTTATWPQQ